jgi:hypothetical protein
MSIGHSADRTLSNSSTSGGASSSSDGCSPSDAASSPSHSPATVSPEQSPRPVAEHPRWGDLIDGTSLIAVEADSELDEEARLAELEACEVDEVATTSTRRKRRRHRRSEAKALAGMAAADEENEDFLTGRGPGEADTQARSVVTLMDLGLCFKTNAATATVASAAFIGSHPNPQASAMPTRQMSASTCLLGGNAVFVDATAVSTPISPCKAHTGPSGQFTSTTPISSVALSCMSTVACDSSAARPVLGSRAFPVMTGNIGTCLLPGATMTSTQQHGAGSIRKVPLAPPGTWFRE